MIVYPAENGELQNPQIFPVAEQIKDPACVSKEEAEVANGCIGITGMQEPQRTPGLMRNVCISRSVSMRMYMA